MEAILTVKDLVLDTGGKKNSQTLVDGVSFTAYRGRMLAIVGESGSGKSLTVSSVAHLLPSAVRRVSGEITLYAGDTEVRIDRLAKLGREMRRIRGLNIGMVFQDPMAALNPVQTIGRQVTERLLAHTRVSRADANVRAIALLESLGIGSAAERFHRYPHEFSGGMRQRVMIAIALICDPDLVLADEPTTALDVIVQAQILALLRDMVDDGRAVVLITHNMGLVAEYADDVAVMYQGQIIERGTVEEVLGNPKHPYTAGLLRCVPVMDMDRDVDLATISTAFTQAQKGHIS